MADSSNNIQDMKQRLILELKQDKKRAAILAIVAIVGVVVIGKFVVKQMTPSEVTAAGSGNAVVFPSSPREAVTAFEDLDIAEDDAPARRNIVRRENYSFTRDIFLPNPEFFPPQKGSMNGKASITDVPDEVDETEMAIQVIQAQAQALVLQSTVISATPSAIINGRVLRTGEWISGFKIVEITSHSCIVEKDAVKITLEMQN